MKKTKISLMAISALLTLIAVFATSCEKEEFTEQPVDNITNSTEIIVTDLPILEVQDGMLIFEDNQQFFNTIELLNNASPEVVKEWEKSIGFKSLNTLQKEALDELELLDEENFYYWLNKYDNLFEIIINEDGEEEISTKIFDFTYSSICNNEQMFLINDKINVIWDNNLTIAPKEDKQKLINEIEAGKDISYPTQKLFITLDTKEDKPKQHIATAIKDQSGCRRDRKVKIRNYITHYPYEVNGIYSYTIKISTVVNGYRKFACIWRPYKTKLTYNSVKGEIYYNRGYFTVAFNLGSKNSNYETYSLSRTKTLVYGTTTSQIYANNMLTDVYFKKDYGKASSRGVGSLWATIDYNY